MNEKTLTIRIKEELHAALKRMGEKQNLSLNALVNIALNEHVYKRYKLAVKAKEDVDRWYNHTEQLKKDAKKD